MDEIRHFLMNRDVVLGEYFVVVGDEYFHEIVFPPSNS
jgi:hypothetical protein